MNLICRIENANTLNDELVVHYDDAVFSICTLITGPHFPLARYDSRYEVPIAKFWASETAQDELEEDDSFEDADFDALEEQLAAENQVGNDDF